MISFAKHLYFFTPPGDHKSKMGSEEVVNPSNVKASYKNYILQQSSMFETNTKNIGDLSCFKMTIIASYYGKNCWDDIT